jgi:hypothetical protein
VGGQALRGTDKTAWSELDDTLGIASLDELDAYITQTDRFGFGPGSKVRVGRHTDDRPVISAGLHHYAG